MGRVVLREKEAREARAGAASVGGLPPEKGGARRQWRADATGTSTAEGGRGTGGLIHESLLCALVKFPQNKALEKNTLEFIVI